MPQLSDIEFHKLARDGVFDVHPDEAVLLQHELNRTFVVTVGPAFTSNGAAGYRVVGTIGELRAMYEARQPGPALCLRAATCPHAHLVWGS
jgi:hypothetical protein